jgi:uncharacterized iron-regulated membrane protein
MRAHLFWRKVHYWLSIVAALPILVMTGTGLLLQVKKDFHWIQPDEQRGSGATPQVTFDQILAACQSRPELGVGRWDDIRRVDLDPADALLKVTTRAGWEAQLDAADGRVLQVAYRRSDVIEALHDGAWFGALVKRWVFLPAGVILLVLWATGIYLFLLPPLRKWGRSAVVR